MKYSADPLSFLEFQRNTQKFSVLHTQLRALPSWSLRDAEIQHDSGRFFSLVGLEWNDIDGNPWASLFVKQPEIGTLGFVVSIEETTSFLVDAKFEPGNTKFVDFAPTLQATLSNQQLVHGGRPPRLVESFAGLETLSQPVVQSEQGSRFLNKWNLNVLKVSEEKFEAPLGMAWIKFKDLQGLLLESHSLNTDARSVITTGPWEHYFDPTTAFKKSEPFALLHESWHRSIADTLMVDVEERLSQHFGLNFVAAVQIDLMLADGDILLDSVFQNTGLKGIYVLVESSEREANNWGQPLLGRSKKSTEILLGADFEGGTRFLFEPVVEIGFEKSSQLGCSAWTKDAGRSLPANSVDVLSRQSTLVSKVTQSDEGGRFYRQICDYEIRKLDSESAKRLEAGNGVWLTLSEINYLSSRPGFFTNEARTTISMLLALA
jgi:oxidase EvaA